MIKSIANYDRENEILRNIQVNLYDYTDPQISVKGDNTIRGYAAIYVAFKKCAPFSTYFTKIYGTTVDDAEDLDLVMSMYYFLE